VNIYLYEADDGTHLGGGVDGEAELGLLAVVDGQALQQQRAEARAGAATDGVEDQEALQPGAVVRQLADAVQAQVHHLLRSDGKGLDSGDGITND